jgi:hypothetical protein
MGSVILPQHDGRVIRCLLPRTMRLLSIRVPQQAFESFSVPTWSLALSNAKVSLLQCVTNKSQSHSSSGGFPDNPWSTMHLHAAISV